MARNQLDDLVRTFLTSSGPRFASVAFVKQDGTLRHMTYVNAKHRAKHMAHTERGDKASRTFAANNPDKVHVFDAHKQAFRTVTLPRVVSLRVDGKTIRVRSYKEACQAI